MPSVHWLVAPNGSDVELLPGESNASSGTTISAMAACS